MRRAVLGEEIPVVRTPQTGLSIRDTVVTEYLYTVQVDGVDKSAIIVEQVGTEWVARSLFGAGCVRDLRAALSTGPSLPGRVQLLSVDRVDGCSVGRWVDTELSVIPIWGGRGLGTPEEAAEAGLTALKELVRPRDCRQMGFGSLSQVEGAILGDEFRVVSIADSIWCPPAVGGETPITEYLFPVQVDSAGQRVDRAAVVVERVGATWLATRLGGPNFVRALLSAVAAAGGSSETIHVLRVDRVANCFVARWADGQLRVTPLWRSSALHLEAYHEVLADSVAWPAGLAGPVNH